jgi:hypothetical protein
MFGLEDELYERISVLEKENEQLLGALEGLLDTQPSSSPIWDNRAWDLAMDFATQVVARAKGEDPT